MCPEGTPDLVDGGGGRHGERAVGLPPDLPLMSPRGSRTGRRANFASVRELLNMTAYPARKYRFL